MERILIVAQPDTTAMKLPPLSPVDYLLGRDSQITAGIEIKTRKETVEQVQSYGGLMLKHRKLVEMQTLASLLRTRCHVAFCFENAEGPILLADVDLITDLQPETPPDRRNYRGLSCDEEPVVYLDWTRHLRRIT